MQPPISRPLTRTGPPESSLAQPPDWENAEPAGSAATSSQVSSGLPTR